jgi:predicted ferric reductase
MCTHDADAKQDPPACPRVQSGIHAVLDGPYPLVAYDAQEPSLVLVKGGAGETDF